MSINDRIRMVRHELGLSQARMAKEISVSSGYIASLEAGSRRVNERLVRLIASTFAVSESWLREGVGEMFTPDVRLNQAIAIFKRLRPEFQDYALNQIDQLLHLQENCSASAK